MTTDTRTWHCLGRRFGVTMEDDLSAYRAIDRHSMTYCGPRFSWEKEAREYAESLNQLPSEKYAEALGRDRARGYQ